MRHQAITTSPSYYENGARLKATIVSEDEGQRLRRPQTANRLDPRLCSRFTDEEALKLAKLLWNGIEVFMGRDREEGRRRERSEG